MDDLKERLVHAEVEQLLQPSSISSQNPILGVSSPKRPDLKNKVLEMYVDQTLAFLAGAFSPMRLFSLIEISHRETQIMLHFLSGLNLLETY